MEDNKERYPSLKEGPFKVSAIGIKNGTYEGYISRLTIDEVFAAPDNMHEKLQAKISDSTFIILEENTESISLAAACVNDGAIPGK